MADATRDDDHVFIPAPQPPAWARAGLLLLVPLLLVLVWWNGQSYDAGLIRFERAAPGEALEGKLPDKLGGLQRAGAVRAFRPETLFEYVNGHADYYLKAGFQRLVTAEYGPPEAPVLVVDLFDMGKGLHAFGVLMEEAGSDPRPAELGEMGFAGARDARFMVGPYYVRMTVFTEGTDPLPVARAVAQGLEGAEGAELSFRFPDFGTATGTRFVKSSYRGLEFLMNVVERRFAGADGELVAFLLLEGAEKAVRNLTAFLSADGIPFEARPVGSSKVYLVDDPYEGPWFFAPLGNRLVGGFGAWTPAREKAVLAETVK